MENSWQFMLKESELTRNFCFQQRITQITRIFHGLFLSRQALKIFKKDFQRISARKGTKEIKFHLFNLLSEYRTFLSLLD